MGGAPCARPPFAHYVWAWQWAKGLLAKYGSPRALVSRCSKDFLEDALGFELHGPLARVPENTLKFIVGVLLSAFGTFWVGEGAGFVWPGSDLAIPLLMAAYLAIALCLVPACRAQAGAVTVEG